MSHINAIVAISFTSLCVASVSGTMAGLGFLGRAKMNVPLKKDEYLEHRSFQLGFFNYNRINIEQSGKDRRQEEINVFWEGWSIRPIDAIVIEK